MTRTIVARPSLVVRLLLVGLLPLLGCGNPDKVVPLLQLNPVPSVVAGTAMTLSGRLLDSDTGAGLSGKSIALVGTGLAADSCVTTTGGIRIEDEKGAQVYACPNCFTEIDPGVNRWGIHLLRLHVGGKILLPPETHGLTLVLQDMGVQDFAVRVTRGDGSVAMSRSSGAAPDALHFNIVAAEGLVSVEVAQVAGGAQGYLGISHLRTFDPKGDPVEEHSADFDQLDTGSYPVMTIDDGAFFITLQSPTTSALPMALRAVFSGDDQAAPASSDEQTFTLQDSSLGAGNPSPFTDYAGSEYSTIACAQDTDGDGLCDDWELGGIPYVDAAGHPSRYSLCHTDVFSDVWGGCVNQTLCPSPKHKDVFVEIDAMRSHGPNPAALRKVIKAFGMAPITTLPDGGDQEADAFGRTGGVTLHLVPGDEVAHVETLHTWRDSIVRGIQDDADPSDDFVSIKQGYFGTLKERIVTVSDMSARLLSEGGPASGGCVRLEERDITVTAAGGGGTQGKIKTRVAVTFSGDPGTVTCQSVTLSGSSRHLQAGTPTCSMGFSDSTYHTATVEVTIPIAPDAGMVGAPLGTMEVTLAATRSLGPGAQASSLVASRPIVQTSLLEAKAWAYHYALFAHSIGSSCGPSGLAEVDGNDLVVALGCGFSGNVAGHYSTDWTPYSVGSVEEQAGTLMHELGHNLGLDHGGPRQVLVQGHRVDVDSADSAMNCKPNYLSVMSYARQFPSWYFPAPSWDLYGLDYARQALPTLVETALDENARWAAGTDNEIAYATGDGSLHLATTGQSVDWNGDGVDDGIVADDLNDFGISGCRESAGQTLKSFSDWDNLQYNFRPSTGAFDGISSDPRKVPEMTAVMIQKMRRVGGGADPQ